MLVLAMAATGSRQSPSIILDKPDQLSDFHPVPSFIRAAV
jgi:hypothetical protein